jgi:hypothetical protein
MRRAGVGPTAAVIVLWWAAPARAATQFAMEGSSVAAVSLVSLLAGFLFCTIVAIINIMANPNKLLRTTLLIGAIALTRIAFVLAAEFPTVAASNFRSRVQRMNATALTENSLKELGQMPLEGK